jgi:raffinose/stachyose/melibiose transport system permease protein
MLVQRTKRWSKTPLLYAILAMLALLWAYPMIQAVIESLKINGFSNYASVIHYHGISYYRVLLNSFFISGSVCLIVSLFSSLGAYGISKMNMPFKNVFYYGLLACLAIPPAAVLSPLFTTAKQLHLMNTYWGLILPIAAFNAPFMLLVMKNYFDTIPDGILEAARIDGCSPIRIYYTLILPLGLPAIVNTMVLTFIYSWNDFMLPLMFIRDESKFTVTLAAQFFSGTTNQTPEMVAMLYAALVLMSIPSILIYLFSQRYLQAGLTAGAVKS